MSRQTGYDRHITVFSPEGRLYQIEYAVAAVKGCGITSVALKGKDSCVVVTQKKVPDKLMDPSFVTSLYTVTSNIGCVITGISADARHIVYRARDAAGSFKDENGYEIPVHHLARKIADIAQRHTQHAVNRPLGIISAWISMDDEKGPQLYRTDPSGMCIGYKACAMGNKEPEATNALEKIVKKQDTRGGFDTKETIEHAISCLQQVLSVDFKSSDIEVGVVCEERKLFTRLGPEEIDEHLTNIAERD